MASFEVGGHKLASHWKNRPDSDSCEATADNHDPEIFLSTAHEYNALPKYSEKCEKEEKLAVANNIWKIANYEWHEGVEPRHRTVKEVIVYLILFLYVLIIVKVSL